MKIYTQGLTESIAVASIVILLIDILRKRQTEGDATAYGECIRALDDFLWSYAGIATSDGDEHECDSFLRSCGYDKD